MLIVNPNLAIDRTIRLERLEPGTVIRTGAAVTTLGGKGVNVARIARRYGHDATIVSFLAEADAALLGALAAAEGAQLAGITVPGTARGASILLERSGRVTVLNEPGVVVTAQHLVALGALVGERASGNRTLVCSGSLPPGAPADAYATLVALGRAAGLTTVVDAHSAALGQVLASAPDVVSPNLHEAEAVLFGTTGEPVEPTGPDVVARAAAAVAGLRARGARDAIVSAGSHGVAFSVGAATWWCPAPSVEVVNPIGAGDSLVGGLVHALESGRAWPDAVAFAVAVASASCEDERAGGVDPDRVEQLVAGLAPAPITDAGAPGAVTR